MNLLPDHRHAAVRAGAVRIAFALWLVALCALLPLRTARADAVTAAVLPISSGWDYLQNNTSDAKQAQAATGWTRIDLPHTWNAFDPTDTVPGYRRDASWYRKNLTIAPAALRMRHSLLFEAANMKADVYVNGARAGAHVGGYLPFEVDVTQYLRSGVNTVLVRVDNSLDRELIPSQSSDFTLYGGLTRDAFLLVRPQTYIANLVIETPQVSAESATTRITATLVNFPANFSAHSAKSMAATLALSVRDPSGNAAAALRKDVTVTGGEMPVSFDLPAIGRPALWSPRTPALYTVEVQLTTRDGTLLHTASDRYGYRWFKFEPHGAFYLNGERLLIRGTHRHEEHAGFGGAMPNALHRADLKLAKEMGANFLRLAHYPQDPEVYRAADELGLLIWDELPWCRGGVGNTAWKANTERLLREQIARNRNHPSIIIWSLGNEIDWLPDFDGGGDTNAISAFLSRLQTVAKELDPGRLTGVRKYYAGANIIDVFSPSMWPGWYSSGYSQYEQTIRKAQQTYPRLLHMEYGGDSHVGRHLNEVRDGSAPAEGAPSIANTGAWDETYIVDLFDWYLHVTERMPDYPGNAQWALKDFATPIRPENPIPYVNQKGVLDREGRPKEAYWVFKSYWTEPVGDAAFCRIYGHSWTYRYGEANKPRPVRVYCNTPQARLTHNGVDLGMRDRDISKFPAAGLVWDVPFTEGQNTLEATGYVNSAAVAHDQLSVNYRIGGNGPLDDIALTATAQADGLMLIEAVALDAKGRRVLDSAERVHFSVDQAGSLLTGYGVPDKSAVIEMANGRATILYRPEPGRAGVVGVVSQNFRGRYITVK